jgi:hypothetical protein
MKIVNMNDVDNSSFINQMRVYMAGSPVDVTQYKEGEWFYMDNGVNLTRFSINNQPPTPSKPSDFNLEYYTQEFASLLDASKLNELSIGEKVSQITVSSIKKRSEGSNTYYDIVLANQLVSELTNSVINSSGIGSELEENINPSVNRVNSFMYTARENSAGFIDQLIYIVDLDVLLPAALTGEAEDEEKNLQLSLQLDIVNPGQPVTITLPDNLEEFVSHDRGTDS